MLIGKEDWLYYTGENNIQDHECTMPFTKTELAAIRERLLAWNERLQQRGIRFYVVIAPNKESIYPQYLPTGCKQACAPAVSTRYWRNFKMRR